MFACGDIPDDNDAFCRLVEKEAVYQVRRLDNHPCMLLWNGGNEIKEAFAYSNRRDLGHYLTDYLLFGICARFTDVPYFRACPWSYTDFGNDVTSGESHQCALFDWCSWCQLCPLPGQPKRECILYAWPAGSNLSRTNEGSGGK